MTGGGGRTLRAWQADAPWRGGLSTVWFRSALTSDLHRDGPMNL